MLTSRGYRWFQYAGVREHTLGAAFDEQGFSIRMNALNGSFFMCGLEVQGADSGETIRARDPQGQYFQSAPIRQTLLNDINLPCPIRPPYAYPFNSLFIYDLAGPQTEGPADIWTILHGFHELDDALIPDPSYPAKYTETPYTHRVRVTVPAAANTRIRVPVFLPFNANFAVRALNWAVVTGDISTGDLRAQLFDFSMLAYSNIQLPLSALFSGSPEYPVTPSPEIMVPAGRGLTLDIFRQDIGSLGEIELAFKGALLNASA